MSSIFNRPTVNNNVPTGFTKPATKSAVNPVNNDAVNSPAHYQGNGIECIDAIKAALTEEEFMGYLKGNNIKYSWRAGKKSENPIEDIKKSLWYQNRLLGELENVPNSK